MSVLSADKAHSEAHTASVGVRRWRLTEVRVGGVLVLTIAIASLLSPLIYPHPNAQNLAQILQGPSLAHPMGTDELGRNVFARALHAGLLDIGASLAMTAVPLIGGVALGALAGYRGGWSDTLVMRFVDLLVAFPYYLLVLVVIAILGPGLLSILIAVWSIGWTAYARIARAEMLVVREQPYIAAACAMGFSGWRVVGRHALPNIVRPCLVFSINDLVANITLLASLSFLGFGIQPPTPEWGAMIADGQLYVLTAWWIATLPGILLLLWGIGLSLMSDGLAERLGRAGTVTRGWRALRMRRTAND